MKKVVAIILCCALLCSCDNETTFDSVTETQAVSSLLTESNTTVQTSADAETIELPVTTVPVAKKQEYEVVNLLSEFAVEPRRLNEAGAKRAADFISDKLDSYGWIVSKEEFPVYRYADVISEPYNLGGDSEIMGTGVNVIADMPRYDENKRTIILSAHYDTTKDNIGIIDNGSGTALLLSAAEMLSDANPDFNIRLIFFDMEEYSMYGSKYHLQNMTENERNNIIADINFDMVGGSSDSLTISTSNGFDSSLSIYLNGILNDKYSLSAKGMYSDSNPFMYHQIPAITFIDESLPLVPVEEKENIDFLSDETFNAVLSDIVLIINNFDQEEFRETKSANIETEYDDFKPFSSMTEMYEKLTTISVTDFKLNRAFTRMYDNGISSCFCCEYTDDDGRVFVIETLSEIIYNEKKKVLNGIPTFEDCKAAAKNEELLADEMANYRIIGNLNDDELKIIWEYMR